MTKVYPNGNGNGNGNAHTHHQTDTPPPPVELTVWNKSLVFNCYGFTVFDSNGNLLFRVDNYSTRITNPQILLMDASGHSLLTIRRKRLSLLDWVVYQGETAVNPPLFTVTKHVNLLLNTKSLAHVTTANTIYQIEGSYTQRSCVVYDDQRRRRLVEIKRKEAAVGGVAFGGDVFRLFLHDPHQMDAAVAMAIVIILDQMFL